MNQKFFCPPCGSEAAYRFVKHQDSPEFNRRYEIWECSDCGTKRSHPFLTDEQLREYYSEEKIVGEGKYYKWRRKYRYIHDWVSRRIKIQGTKVLEIGSNSGNLLRYFKEHSNCQVLGIELSIKCKEYSEKVNAVPVFNGTMEKFKMENEKLSDLVIMVHVLEHIPEPKDFLEQVRTILKPGGYVYIEIPNADMIDFDLVGDFSNPLRIPFHSYIYNLDSVLMLLQKNGFRILARRNWSRKEDGGSITSAYAKHFRYRFEQALGKNWLSTGLGSLAKGLVRFYPNRYVLGYYFSKRGRSSSIALLGQKADL